MENLDPVSSKYGICDLMHDLEYIENCNGYYVVKMVIFGKQKYFGSYRTIDEAANVRISVGSSIRDVRHYNVKEYIDRAKELFKTDETLANKLIHLMHKKLDML